MSGLKCFIIIPRDDSSDHAIVPIDYVNGGVQPGKLYFPQSFHLGRNFPASIIDVYFVSAKLACDAIILSQMPNLQGFCQLCTDLHTDGVCQRILACFLMEESAQNAFALNNERTMW